ncbi:hypothetical protein LBW89_20335 [Paenibacillus sp. alder61]|uniref:Colicin import membrane protein n=1 Tax=Paenibacillus faecis TaxID=862114 RepID=A0A5D0CL29_9BACL|nr:MULTISPECIES: hypothetical protein [Paenibacillus]MCA1295360.1 hypothetical protein [Paenibacillus sp. alder61]TYA10240.1 hypothetical protein FRY98_27035 [Paenibacillus faecis]
MNLNKGLCRWTLKFLLTLVLLTAVMPVVGMSTARADGWEEALLTVDTLHDSFSALESLIKLEKLDTQTLRKQNNDRLKAIQTKIKNIDKGKLEQFKASYDQALKKHAPSLEQYKTLTKQAAAARKTKDAKKAALLDLKRNNLKPAVDAAKLDIANRKSALTTAKKQAAAKAKEIRTSLASIQPLKKQIAAENKLINRTNKNKSAAEKLYRAAIKKGNAVMAAAQMTIMYAELGKVNQSQKKIHAWEKQIEGYLKAAESKLP